jgi:hypothetical protein
LSLILKKASYLFKSYEIFGLVKKLKSLFQNSSADIALESLLKVHSVVVDSGLTAKPISKTAVEELFMNPNVQWSKQSNHLSNGINRIGIIRISKPHAGDITENDFANLATRLPLPYEVCISIQKITRGKNEFHIYKRLKQTASSTNNPREAVLNESLVKTVSESLKNGSEILEYEYLFIFIRNSESELAETLSKAASAISRFAEATVETFGVAPSWLAHLNGNPMHVSLKELDDVLPLMLPVWHFGESSLGVASPSTLALHRTDGTVFNFDLFDKSYSVFNSLIIGTSGRGKSVLCGLLTKSVLNDSNIKVIKVDVGGSHSKECELFQGDEFKISINVPSGINPFAICLDAQITQQEKVMLLSNFVSVLIKEQNETFFSKDLKQGIESCVSDYLVNVSDPSLHDFYIKQTKLPRRNLLSRWVDGGIYESAFKANQTADKKPSRLRYYNFSQIFEAADPDFAQAGLAAVLVQFNYECLKSSTSKVVLICDETPFFVKACFEFFKFTTANVRKFGHAVVLVSQLSQDLIINGDSGIIENSPQQFLFSADGNEAEFTQNFQLTKKHYDTIRNLKSIPGEVSECLFKNQNNARKLHIRITKEEYWELTSSKKDNLKVQSLRTYVPELTLKEAIKCLSI